MEEFRYLKGFSNYGFTRSGGCFNHRTKRWLRANNVSSPDRRKESGYVKLELFDDDGNVHIKQRHRCIAILFVKGRSEVNKIVNHLNGIPGDDRAENLEWTTYQGNVEHAGMMGLTTKCIPISVRNVETGEITHYPSATKAGKATWATKDAVLWRVSAGEGRVFPGGFQYRIRDDSRPWLEPSDITYGRRVPILVRDVLTGVVKEYARQLDFAKEIKTCLAVINIASYDCSQRLIQDRYQIKLKTDPTPWREVKDIYRESGVKKAIIVTNTETGVEQIFASAKECAQAMGLLTTTLNERLNKNGAKIYNGFTYRRY